MIPALLLISKEKFWYKISLISLSPQIAALSFLHVKCTTRSNRQQIKSQYISVFPLICKSFCIMPSSKLFTSIILGVLYQFCWGSKGIQCILEVNNNQNFIHIFICPLFLKVAEALLFSAMVIGSVGTPLSLRPQGPEEPQPGGADPWPSESRWAAAMGSLRPSPCSAPARAAAPAGHGQPAQAPWNTSPDCLETWNGQRQRGAACL